MVEGALAP